MRFTTRKIVAGVFAASCFLGAAQLVLSGVATISKELR